MELTQLALLWASNNIGVWSAIAVAAFLDTIPSWQARKLQPKEDRLTAEQWRKCFLTTIRNEVFLLFFLLMPMLWLYQPREEWLWSRLPFELAVMIFVNDTAYYWTHRLFHLPRFYKHFHKKHHTFTAPEGIAAIYMTVPEFYINQVLPATLGMMLTGVPFPVALIYYFVSGFGGTMSHSGYERWAEHHDDHHRLFNCNYGFGGSLWDKLMGTDLKKPLKAA